MNMAYALLSMVFAGVNDFVFKQYIGRKGQRLGHFITGAGLVWTLVFGACLLWRQENVSLTHWPISLGAGAASVLANLLLIHSMRTVPAGTGATIYRLNLVVVAVMGVVFLGESITTWKVVGVALGAACIWLLRAADGDGRAGQMHAAALLMLVAACILRAAMGILYKLSDNYEVPKLEVVAISGACWLVGGLLFSRLRREPARWTGRTWGYSILSGLLICGIVYPMIASLSGRGGQASEASIVLPVAQLSFVLTAMLGVLFHRERLGWRRILALAAAVGSATTLWLSLG